MSRLLPVEAATVVQATDINKLRTLIFYQSTMSLLVIYFTYLEGRDVDVVIN